MLDKHICGGKPLPGDLNTADFTPVTAATMAPPKQLPPKTDWNKLLGPNLFAMHDSAKSARPEKVPGGMPHKTVMPPHEKKLSASELKRCKEEALATAQSLVTVQPDAPENGWDDYLLKPMVLQPKVEEITDEDLGEGVSPEESGEATKSLHPSYEYEYEYKYKHAPGGNTKANHPTHHTAQAAANEYVKSSMPQCRPELGGGYECHSQHMWPGYQCAPNCTQIGCLCRATKAASCKHFDGNLKCVTGSVVQDCGGQISQMLVEKACEEGAVGLL